MKTIFCILILISCVSNLAHSQTATDTIILLDNDTVYQFNDSTGIRPKFPGAPIDFFRHFDQYTIFRPPPFPAQVLPRRATVFVSFIVERDGIISNVEIIRGSTYDDFNETAIRAVKSMPNWKPAQRDGKPIRVRWVVPVRFSHPI